MKTNTIIIFCLLTIGLGVLLSAPFGRHVATSQDVVRKGAGTDTKQRFGVDGVTTISFIKTIAEIGDGWSGANNVRWGVIEPKPPQKGRHSYDWKFIDEPLKIFQKTGRKLQVNIRIYNDWALDYSKKMKVDDPQTGHKVSGIARIKPTHLDDWKAFITAFVERYDADGYDDMPGIRYPISHIQIESEAENSWESIDGYVEALCTAYKAAKKTFPDIQIMAGGFNMFDFFSLDRQRKQEVSQHPFIKHKINFIKGFFTKAADCFDILSVHLERGEESVIPTIRWYKEQMELNKFQKPIWSEDTCSVPYLAPMTYGAEGLKKLKLMKEGDAKTVKWFRQEQAKLLVKKSVLAFAAGVEKVFVSTDTDWPDYYLPMWRYAGLLDANGNRKLAFYVFKTMVSKIDHFLKIETLNLSPGIAGYRFVKPSGAVYVVWSDKEAIIKLPVKSKKMKVTDISGNVTEVLSSEIRVSPDPIFVEE
jgi:hypothetical protein